MPLQNVLGAAVVVPLPKGAIDFSPRFFRSFAVALLTINMVRGDCLPDGTFKHTSVANLEKKL